MENTLQELGLEEIHDLWRWMITAREMDLIEQSFTGRGEAFFHVSGAGHEGAAILQFLLGKQDWLHCHYRDKALMLARGISPEMFFMSLFTKDGSHSRGRQMNAHMSAPELNVLSIVGPVGDSALQAAGVAATVRDAKDNPVVLCSLGDGMTQQGEVLEALAHAVRENLPVLFLIQDNAYAISTVTSGRTFYDLPSGPANEFYGIPIVRINGRQPLSCYQPLRDVIAGMRKDRAPRIVIFEVDRLDNHTNADDQRVYRFPEDIAAVRESSDPIPEVFKALLEAGLSSEELKKEQEEIQNKLIEDSLRAQRSAEPVAVHSALAPLKKNVAPGSQEYRGGKTPVHELPEKERRTMLEAIRGVLDYRLESDKRVRLFGEDIEDPKGDVFGITKGLSKDYPGRVQNSPLAEASILGVSVGRALAGDRPVAFLQFADFLPIAYNQIFSELGSMYWRTDGKWQAPVIVMITCGGYRPGLGPFHASSLEALAAHTPGIDVCMPSTAGDAAGMLNAAFESGRPTLFFYPKNCLNNREEVTGSDLADHIVPIGTARTVQVGNDITLVGYGNTVSLCSKAAETLTEVGVSAEVIDLRHIMPWDKKAIVESAEKTGRLLVSHEDNYSAGVGAEIIATIAESTDLPIKMRRVTRADTYVPCNFGNQLEVLPSYKRILETAVEMLDGAIQWEQETVAGSGEYLIDAIGSSPSDEEVLVLEWNIKPGDVIEAGQKIAELEADKAVFDLMSPVGGTLVDYIIPEGNRIAVGKPLAKVRLEDTSLSDTDDDDLSNHVPIKPITRENPGTPHISGIRLGLPWQDLNNKQSNVGTSGSHAKPSVASSHDSAVTIDAGIIAVAGVTGSLKIDNEEISRLCPTWTPQDIVKRTGIHFRTWVGKNEDAVELGFRAAQKLLRSQSMNLNDIDYIVCSTGTPMQHTPSMATIIQYKLAADSGLDNVLVPCVDLNAACSGYLYALQHASDYLIKRPGNRVLVITTEVLSPQIDRADPNTAPIFGDAASATLVGGRAYSDDWKLALRAVELAAEGEPGDILRVPATADQTIFMDGVKVFVKAIAMMVRMLRSACDHADISLEQLDLIVPHQANQRIINAVRQRMKVPQEKMFSNIANLGNTSSSTIPLALIDAIPMLQSGQLIGLTAFGGGFTFGGAVLQVVN
ncbi:beta-ketoacyl-ACP synthase 3 [Marinobacter halodurans]|uniref:3-methyl-2-oxobutanoate dehydrogenase (2-methylpropanoyl-transferring) n=1 Tax=Marinobacter halodurans TaxID=2528979 RepID=A0ABY1ZDX6_9GAMM|nr:beta-ketoacyl-ACP synthase 3 [Marinobacter halodurans]TBW47663.1 beta-ketoacyl-ACP synthase 3 [Marinobacter halodurans]